MTRGRKERRRPLAIAVRLRNLELTDEDVARIRSATARELAKFGQRVESATLRISDVNGLVGAPLVLCRITVALSRLGRVIVESRRAEAASAFEACVAAAERAVRRLVDRRVKTHRHGGRPRVVHAGGEMQEGKR